jgi:hypothetical protein
MNTNTATTTEDTMTTLKIAILSGRGNNLLALESGTERTERGVLTTEHAASSYGLPVVVRDDGVVIGPKDLDNLRIVPSPIISDDIEGNEHHDYPEGAQATVQAARRAGYSVRDCD